LRLLRRGIASSYEMGRDGIEGMLRSCESRGRREGLLGREGLYAGREGVKGSPGRIERY